MRCAGNQTSEFQLCCLISCPKLCSEVAAGGFFRRTHYSSTQVQAGHTTACCILLCKCEFEPVANDKALFEGPDGDGQALSAILYLMLS